MHHFIYPSKDTYITNQSELDNKNFGLDEILQIGTSNVIKRTLNDIKIFYYSNEIFNNHGFNNFTGILTGSFGGSASYVIGTISGSSLELSASYFSGSIDGVSQILSASVVSGSLISGNISGSIIFPYLSGLFIGQITSSDGCFTGNGTGRDVMNEQNWTTDTVQIINRSLFKFDITSISKSISNGEVTNPNFFLKVNVCNEYELPITYNLYALPISQSWEMGDGYWSDNGSNLGASWKYRDGNGGNNWYSQSLTGSHPPINFISDPSLSTASFAYGGGTWYTSSWCSQSFQYQASDVYMNITPMAMAWISGTLPNEGLILISSDELISTGSGFVLKFFSENSNTIYSPCLDVSWNDATFITGSESTASISFVTKLSGITASIQSGSTFIITGGVSGSFSASTFINFGKYHTTGSNELVSGSFLDFSGSFSGSFGTSLATFIDGYISGSSDIATASYFSGSIDNVSVELLASTISGSEVVGIITGSSLITASYISYFEGFVVNLSGQPIIISGSIITASYLNSELNVISGIVDGNGLSGNISGMPVVGPYFGTVEISSSEVTGSCGNTFTAQYASASFTGGIFSGSRFTAYYIDYKFENAILTGSWTDAALLGTTITIPLPSTIAPYAYAYVSGTYVNGKALGTYIVSGSNSASFNGQFIQGNLIGGYLNAQLSGSVYTSSFVETGSVEMTSSLLFPMDINNPFTINIQNLFPEYRAGDIVKIGVFGRKQFPLKTFGKTTQQQQYLIPEFLPSSSYYALKDNQTEEIILNFDSYTQLSCEYPQGNYFIIDTTGLPQERYYRILIRINYNNKIYTIDTGKTFKIVRG